MFLIGSNHPRWAGVKLCATCKTELIGARARKKSTCSKKCESVHRSRAKSKAGNGRWKGGHVLCRECGVEIVHHGRIRATYCSRKCMGLWQSKHLSKENSPLWKGGSAYGEYPPEFNTKFRAEIRKRDGFRCQDCGKKSIHLDVHHKDQNKKNSNPENLISLCRSCHKKEHWRLEA